MQLDPGISAVRSRDLCASVLRLSDYSEALEGESCDESCCL